MSTCCHRYVASYFLFLAGSAIAVKVLESVHEIIEEIEEEYLVLRDHGHHPNLPSFYGLFISRAPHSQDQLWIAMEVDDALLFMTCIFASS